MTNNKIILSLLLGVIGCVPAAMVGTYAVGTSIAEERSVGTIVDDAAIVTKIKNEYAQSAVNNLLSRVTVISKEGRVLLTGSVPQFHQRNKASQLAWKVPGVKEVINEIEVNQKSFNERTSDSYMAMQIRSKLLFEKDLRSVNYTVDVNKGIVFLAGIAQDQHELDKAIDIASKVKGVKKVVSHVTLRTDHRRTNH